MEPVTPPPESPLATVARRVREVRKRRGYTAEKLAERLKEHGVPWERGVVVKFESGRRQSLSVDELYGLALALDCSVMALLVPLDNRPVQVTPARVESADAVRVWITGATPLPGIDEHTYYTEVPVKELGPWAVGEREHLEDRVVQLARRHNTSVSETLRTMADMFEKMQRP